MTRRRRRRTSRRCPRRTKPKPKPKPKPEPKPKRNPKPNPSPNPNPNPDQVSEAYEVLSSKDKRATYDQVGKSGMHGAGGMPPNFSQAQADEIFSQFFGGQVATSPV